MAQYVNPKSVNASQSEAPFSQSTGLGVNAYDVSNSERWFAYAQHRPKYPSELFERVYAFHESTGGKFDVAHDAGCGPGMTAAVLAQKFKHVICSDFAGKAVETAKANLTASLAEDQTAATKFTFRQSTAEDMSWITPGSVDLVAMSECIHWTETSKTVSTVSKVLKPRGTFAMWYYTDPHFPDNAAVQSLYTELMHHWIGLRAAWSKESNRTVWIEFTGYNCIGFPEAEGWSRGVRRIKFNTNGTDAIWIRDPKRPEMKYDSQVGEYDILEHVENAKEWELKANVKWIKGWLDSMQPEFASGYLDPYMKRFEEALGGEQVETRVSWPVVLILAKKEG